MGTDKNGDSEADKFIAELDAEITRNLTSYDFIRSCSLFEMISAIIEQFGTNMHNKIACILILEDMKPYIKENETLSSSEYGETIQFVNNCITIMRPETQGIIRILKNKEEFDVNISEDIPLVSIFLLLYLEICCKD